MEECAQLTKANSIEGELEMNRGFDFVLRTLVISIHGLLPIFLYLACRRNELEKDRGIIRLLWA